MVLVYITIALVITVISVVVVVLTGARTNDIAQLCYRLATIILIHTVLLIGLLVHYTYTTTLP